MLLDPGVDIRVSEMEHVILQVRGGAVEHHMFMHFIVPGAGVAAVQPLVTALAMPKKPEVPTGIIAAMFDPAAHEHEAAVDEIAIHRWLPHGGLNLLG